MNEAFGELRSRCHAPPSAVAWQRVCDAVDACPREALPEQALPYVRSHVSEWPDAWRVAPKRWLDRLARGEDVPELEVCEGARLGRGHWKVLGRMLEGNWRPSSLELERTLAHYKASASATDWARWGGLSRLRHLSIRDVTRGGDFMMRLHGNRALAHLRSLTLTNVELHRFDEARILRAPITHHLEVMRLRMVLDARAVAEQLTRGDARPELRVLALTGSQRDVSRTSHLDWEGLSALSDHAEMWPGLEELEVRSAMTGRGEPAAPPDLTAFEQLKALDVGENRLMGVAHWDALTRAGLPPKLERLDVSFARVTLDVLARTLEDTGVVSLNASYLPMSVEDMEELRVSGVLERLTELKLRTHGLVGSVGDALRMWVRADALSLERLALGGAALGEAGVKALARAPLGALTRLEAPRADLGGWHDAFSGGDWPSLRVLRLQSNELDGEAMESWARRGWFARLEELSWGTNRVSMRGLGAALSAWEGGGMKRLDLSECGLGDEEAKLLAGSPALANLEGLELWGNGEITEAGRAALAESPWLPEHIRLEFVRGEASGPQ